MITVSSLLLSTRTKLGDNDKKNQRYSDAEIIDAINDTLAVLSEDLLCFSRTTTIQCKKCVTQYLLPLDFIKPISFTFNGEIIYNIESMESRLSENNNSLRGIAYDNQTVHLFLGEIEDSDSITLYYNSFETVFNKEEYIHLPHNAKEPIVYYMLYLLYQNPIKKDGLKRSEYYLSLYERKKIDLKNRLRGNVQMKNIRCNFIKV